MILSKAFFRLNSLSRFTNKTCANLAILPMMETFLNSAFPTGVDLLMAMANVSTKVA